MKKKIKSAFLFTIIIAMVLSMTGCWNRRELNTIAIVMGVGIDKGKKAEEIEMTTQIVDTSSMKSGSKDGESGDSSAYLNLTAKGTNVIEIFRGYTHEISRKLYLAHNQMIVFGNDYAKDGVHDCLDFFMRDHEARLTVNIFVAKGDAKDIFKAKPELAKIPIADIARRLDIQSATSETASLSVMDLMSHLSSKTYSAVAPLVEIQQNGDKKIAVVSGGAVFKKDKVVGELDKKETRGFLWVDDKVKSGIVRVDLKGEHADIEIIKSKSKVSAKINKDGTIQVKIKVDKTGSISNQTGPENFATPENIKLLENEEEKVIKKEIEGTIQKAQELDADIFGFGEMIHKNHSKEWKKLEGDWDNIFKNINIDIEVKSTISSAGRLAKPNYPPEK